jgi:hypothetical protein
MPNPVGADIIRPKLQIIYPRADNIRPYTDKYYFITGDK